MKTKKIANKKKFSKKKGSSRYNRNSKRKEIEMLLNELNEELENNYQENGFFYPYNEKVQELIHTIISRESLVNLLKYEYNTGHYPILIIEKMKFLVEELNIDQSTDSVINKEINNYKKWITHLDSNQKEKLSHFLNYCQTGDYGVNELTDLIIEPCKYKIQKGYCKRKNPDHINIYHNLSNSNHIATILIEILQNSNLN